MDASYFCIQLSMTDDDITSLKVYVHTCTCTCSSLFHYYAKSIATIFGQMPLLINIDEQNVCAERAQFIECAMYQCLQSYARQTVGLCEAPIECSDAEQITDLGGKSVFTNSIPNDT